MSASFALPSQSISHATSPLMLTNGNQTMQCSIHEQNLADRSSVNSMVGPTPSSNTEDFNKKMSSTSDCGVASQNQCMNNSNKARNDFDQQNHKTNNSTSYQNYAARQHTPNGTMNADIPSNAGTNLTQKSAVNRVDTANLPDDLKLLANPKGIIKSFLAQAAAFDSQKFDAYRELCIAHGEEFYKSQKNTSVWVTCQVCNTSHPHWNTLQRHLQAHIDFRPFNCDQCGRTFYSQSKLKRHQVIHSDVRPYKCPVCDRRLGRTEHLKRHLLVHTDDKPYGCSCCSHTTKRLDGIRRHIKRKHGISEAEIIVLAGHMEPQELSDIRQVINAENQQDEKPKMKRKKKKKKKLAQEGLADAENNQNAQGGDAIDAMSKEYGGNLLEVAARFGLSDLRLTPSVSAAEPERFESSMQMSNNTATNHGKNEAKPHHHDSGGSSAGHAGRRQDTGSVGDEMKSAWDSGLLLGGIPPQQMHLLYHSLARSHPSASGIHPDGTMNVAAPCNLTNDAANLRQSAFCHERAAAGLPMSAPDHPSFIMNSSSVPMRYLPSVAPDAGNSARHVNPMLFSPRNASRNLGHFAGAEMQMPAEAMISQYIQSQQRFAPPVWGFANPNYHNY